MKNNLNAILPLLKFESEDDFYYLQILQRKKENPQLGSNSRVIKNYYINNKQYLLNHFDEIQALCEYFNARAMLRLNKRSFTKVAFKTVANIANSMCNSDFYSVRKSYDRACGLGHKSKGKTWILDIDGEVSDNYLKEMREFIKHIIPFQNKVLAEIPSKNGLHLIVKPFDTRKFILDYPEIEIHKDNPTNLFIP